MDELAEYGFEDAERFAFIEKWQGIFSSIYKIFPKMIHWRK